MGCTKRCVGLRLLSPASRSTTGWLATHLHDHSAIIDVWLMYQVHFLEMATTCCCVHDDDIRVFFVQNIFPAGDFSIVLARLDVTRTGRKMLVVSR